MQAGELQTTIEQNPEGRWVWHAKLLGREWRNVGPFRTRARAEKNLARFERARLGRNPGFKVKPEATEA